MFPLSKFRSGDKVQHFKIFKDEQRKYYLWIKKFPSLNQLVEYHKTSSVSKTQHILLNEVDFRVSTGSKSSISDTWGGGGLPKGEGGGKWCLFMLAVHVYVKALGKIAVEVC